ncbi:hypothetical protein [Vulcanococcus sp.]|jgi:hypothetical protein|uniref:hypothetical protein n=1 Tax=Vulcanococcus sp. TaxID=2856995 RepID=UPI0037D9E04C
MTFRFCDGFDSYTATAQVTRKWSSGSSFTFASTAGKFGGGALTNSSSPYSFQVVKGVSIPSGAKVRVGFYLKYSSGTTAGGTSAGYYNVGFNNNSALSLTPLGQLAVVNYGGSTPCITSSAFVNDGNFHWVELEYYLNGSSSTAQLYIDGISQGSYTGFFASAQAIISVTVALGYTFSGTGWIDDVIVWDDQGSNFNTFPIGPRRISTLVPNADGDLAQFTPKTGTSHYAMVNGGFASTNYVSDSGTGNVDLYKFPALPYSPTSINAVVGNYFAQNTGSGTTSLIPKLKTSGTTVSGATQTLTVGINSLYQAAFLTDAGGSSWSATSVNAMQLGMGD